MFVATDLIHVGYRQKEIVLPVGRLLLNKRKILFEYAPEFLQTGFELSPVKLPLKTGVFTCDDTVFEGLFGVFNDSLPDGWGRLLLDRKLRKDGVQPALLTSLDRLRYVGQGGMGALCYRPDIPEVYDEPPHDLDFLAKEALRFQTEEVDQFVDELFVLNESCAGVRPKIMGCLIEDQYQPTHSPIVNNWLIKLRSSYDPQDSGAIEYAYHCMAKAAGLDVPEARLFPSKHCSGYFGVKRFDKTEEGPVHVHTVSGLLHIDHRVPSLDYETLMKVTLWLTKDVRECEKQFRHCVFNTVAHNRDDHAKNFSFLMDKAGKWHVSPPYDLTFSYGPGGEHCTTIMGEGKSPDLRQLLKLGELSGFKKQRIHQIIEEVEQAVSQWSRFSAESGVTTASRDQIQKAIDHRRTL